MSIGDIFKISRKTFFNPSAWLGYETIKSQHAAIKEDLKEVFRIEKPTHDETFEEAMTRLQVSPDDVQQCMQRFYRFAYFLVCCGLIVFIYAFHLSIKLRHVTPFLLGFAASALLFAQAFRFHFWAYQIRVRKLGVTVNEWMKDLLGDKGAAS